MFKLAPGITLIIIIKLAHDKCQTYKAFLNLLITNKKIV